MENRMKLLCATALLALPLAASASSMGHYRVGAGFNYTGDMLDAGANSVITSTAADPDLYAKGDSNSPNVAGYLMVDRALDAHDAEDALRVGLEFMWMSAKDINGHINQFSIDDNYTYHYKALSQVFMLRSSYELPYHVDHLHFFGFAGIGAAVNSAEDYSEEALPGLEHPRDTTYNDDSDLHLAWEVGVGVDCHLTDALDLVLQYRYLDAGKYQLGKATTNDYRGASGHWRGQMVSLGLEMKL